MATGKNNRIGIAILGGTLLIFLLFLGNISIGSVAIPLGETLSGLTGGGVSKKSWEIILLDYRIPKAITAILAGIALSLSGLQMQTFFRNPLAGPYVLGISSGAGLGVAILLLGGSAFGWNLLGDGGFMGIWGTIIAASTGAILVLVLMSLTAWRVKDSMTLLIIGLMFGSATGAMISVLSYFGGAEELKLFTIWSMGSFGGTSKDQVMVFFVACLLGIIPVLLFVKSFNAMLLGERYAESMGVNLYQLRWAMILSTGVLAGSATAICGPVAFIGIAVPHLARMVFKTGDHRILFPASSLIGAGFLLVCDSVSQMPGTAETLPINAVTSLFGAPLVIWLILKRNFSREF